MSNTQQQGLIFNIQKYSVHDGPGIRTVVFLKGCPLSCTWCSNPESQQMVADLAYNKAKCLGAKNCGRCVASCTNNALAPAKDGSICIDRKACKGCTTICTENCVGQAMISYGRKATVTEIMDDVEKDMPFYARSGGGITLSGGEPLMQGDFALSILKEARKRRIKTCIETCGHVATQTILDAGAYLNYAMFDIKHSDTLEHKKHTGHDNHLVLQNLEALTSAFPKLPLSVRTPVIPGVNDTVECISAIATLVREKKRINPTIQYELLPYHRLGTQKYEFLNRENPLGDVSLETSTFMQLRAVAEKILNI